MDPARKRTVRLVVALTAAVLLSGALVWTSFGAASPERIPSQLVAETDSDRTFKLGGEVVRGSVSRVGEELRFRVRDPQGRVSVPVRYTGAVPDPFREGREVIVTVRRQGDAFVGERDSLVTKCPSKFEAE
jgi:cytochrome c-type biogenesis protein CcmE